MILGIIDPEGYDKENRVYSGGGAVSYPACRKWTGKGGYKMKIGLRVNKGDKEYKRVIDAEVEIGIGGGR